MLRILILLTTILFFSCGDDANPGITDDQLLGTWVLNSVSGECAGFPISGSADPGGCIDNPTLEVNCSIIEFTGPGTLVYAYNLVKGQGTYSFDGASISICTDRCLDYLYDGNALTLQTGTVPLCDPLYSFTKSAQTLDETIATNQRNVIKRVMLNGQLRYSFDYNADGSIQTKHTYVSNGDLNVKETYAFTPLTATVTRTLFPSNSSSRYEYYNEAPNRVRRDHYGSDNQLKDYALYFLNPNSCWADRIEFYENDELRTLINYSYSGENCDLEVTVFNNSELVYSSVITRDGMAPWSKSTFLNILQYRNISNRLSYTYTKAGQVSTDISYNSSYSYDESGFPTSQTKTYLNGEVDFYTYVYE